MGVFFCIWNYKFCDELLNKLSTYPLATTEVPLVGNHWFGGRCDFPPLKKKITNSWRQQRFNCRVSLTLEQLGLFLASDLFRDRFLFGNLGLIFFFQNSHHYTIFENLKLKILIENVMQHSKWRRNRDGTCQSFILTAQWSATYMPNHTEQSKICGTALGPFETIRPLEMITHLVFLKLVDLKRVRSWKYVNPI